MLSLQAQMSEVLRSKNEQIVQLQAEIEAQRLRYEPVINELDQTVKRGHESTLLLDAELMQLHNIIRSKDDVESALSSQRVLNDDLQRVKNELHTQLENASAYIVELEDKFFRQQKTSLELLKNLKEVETHNDDLSGEIQHLRIEIETYRAYIIDLKSRIAVYIPVKNDLIDARIAEYINHYPDRTKLRVMFLRESEGVYQFGSKRIAIKVDKDKINVRVGGGYLSIEEFLDQYTPIEVEKLERRDPVKRVADKVNVSRTIQS